MSKHALLSPSSAERWFNCPGSIQLIEKLPAEAFKSSEYAAEGTVAHSLAEKYIAGKIDLPTLIFDVGKKIKEDGFDIEITDTMIEGIIEYADYINNLRKGLIKPALIVAKAEVKVTLKDFPEVHGTTDYLLYQKGNELHVIDFKYGKTVVESKKNKQGLIYVLAAMDTEAGEVFEKVFFHIVQPRVKREMGSSHGWEITPEIAQKFYEELRDAIEATKQKNAPKVAGPWCRFCPAFGWSNSNGAFVCPESRKNIEDAVQTAFTKIPTPQLPDPISLTPTQLSQVLNAEDLIDSFFERVRECAMTLLLQNPDSIPGWKVVEGKTNRQWRDEREAEAAFGLLGEHAYTKKIKSPTQMEKIAGGAAIEPYVIKPVGKPTVVPASDKRVALRALGDAKDVFGLVEWPIAQIGTQENIFGNFSTATPKKERIWP